MKKTRTFVFILLAGVSGVLFEAFRPADILADLGMNPASTKEQIIANLKHTDYWNFRTTSTMRQMARQIPEGSRAAAVQALGKVVRMFVESAECQQAYREWMKSKYPVDSESDYDRLRAQGQSEEALRKTYQNSLQQSVAATNQAMAQLSPEMLAMALSAQLQATEQELASLTGEERTAKAQEINSLKKQLALAKTNPAQFKKQYLATINQQASQLMAENEQELANARQQSEKRKQQLAELKAHSEVKPVVKQRLRDFIALSSTVDFEAKVVPMGYKKEFVNPVYKNKGRDWKFLYRLGKEPVMAARAFAQNWLNELENSGSTAKRN
ncbi:hypothetical protein [Tellurirhabdus bombi]|uniref:hypothetical protein n=1 Tax=Tellurirhabdus bombi TaxID=2907205 RepID=UPI001F1C8F28|nr:hypothetical protein [Tellurirhabdus bombi]